jgi:hypothetical protein
LIFDDNMRTGAKDGSFRFAGLPGRCVVMARAWEPRFLTGVGADRIKGLLNILGNRLPPLHFSFHAFVEINPAKDAQVVKCNIMLDPGGTLSGTVVDADGRPLAGAQAGGLKMPGAWEPLQTAAFTVAALRPGETRLLQFSHAEKRLAGSLVVRSDTKGPLTVKLKPAGTLTGRFVRPDGKPFADVELYAPTHEPVLAASPNTAVPPAPEPTSGTFPSGLRTDKDGKFCIENLAPGLKYRLAILYKQMYMLRPDDGPARTGASIAAGETKNLGDVTVKLIE